MNNLNNGKLKPAIMIVLAGLIGILSFAGCNAYRRVPVNYRQSPAIGDMTTRSLLIGTFHQKCSGFQAVTDMIRILQRKLEKEKVFRQIDFTLDVQTIPDDQPGIEKTMERLKSTDWSLDSKKEQADLLLTGAVLYDARDRSGYDSEWQLNQYGYRVPKKVYRDRLAFDMELGFILIDLKTGEVILNKTFEDRGLVEGAADEVAVFYELIDKQLTLFLDQLQGKEMKTKRYLLYR